MGINDLDLCVIIGNCLENALEACSALTNNEHRFIDMSTSITKGYLVMKFINSFNDLIEYQKNDLVSSPKSPGHGIGLSGVKSLAAKNLGHCSVSFEQNVFTVSISLSLRKHYAAKLVENA